jgi:hypothetical protein
MVIELTGTLYNSYLHFTNHYYIQNSMVCHAIHCSSFLCSWLHVLASRRPSHTNLLTAVIVAGTPYIALPRIIHRTALPTVLLWLHACLLRRSRAGY